jgi:signal transduction histidine kinase/ActR/RegA family two-component response regulator
LIETAKMRDTEDNLNEQLYLFESLANQITEHAWIVDRSGILLWSNRQWLEYTGLVSDRGQQWGVNSAQPPECVERIGSAIAIAVSSGQCVELDLLLRGQEGRLRFFRCRIIPILDHHGKVSHCLGTHTDIQDSQNKADSLANDADRLKSYFIANLSHEIRTPLSTILGCAELLKPANVEDALILETILRNGRSLLAIFNDILQLSRIHAGEAACEVQEFNPQSLIHEVTSLLTAPAHSKNLAFDVCYESKMPASIQTDPIKLRQILINLLDNAIKFTWQGAVQLNCHYDVSKSALTFAVTDTGIGMAQEDLRRVFKDFEQADNSNVRKYSGTGVGLAISQRLANLLGSNIEVTSQLGLGSTFRFTLTNVASPSTELLDGDSVFFNQSVRAGAAQLKVIDNPGLHDDPLPIHVLVVDDHRDIRLLTSRFIKTWGGSVTEAENGVQALMLLQQSAGRADEFDAVIMDLQMPELDGLSAVRAMRQAGLQLPVIAMTATSVETVRQKCLQAGYNDCLSKPVDFGMLKQLLAKLCSSK